MNIILVSNRLSRNGTLTLGDRQSVIFVMALLVVPFLLALFFTYLLLFHAASLQHPFLQSLVLKAQQHEVARNRTYMQENLNAMAVKLGEMQAQMLRLDALGERLAKFSGVNPQEFNFAKLPPRGGSAPGALQQNLTQNDFTQQMEALMHQLDNRADQLGLMEAMVLQQKVKKVALPSNRPVTVGWYSSNYGWRIDPFTGGRAMHEGVDFMADTGTAVHAAGGGIVVFVDHYASYGNMIDVDHGNGLMSRYAHLSKSLVKVGDVVMKGQKIAEVGNTGRSTGAHLHFEVRLNGVPKNPAHYLNMPS